MASTRCGPGSRTRPIRGDLGAAPANPRAPCGRGSFPHEPRASPLPVYPRRGARATGRHVFGRLRKRIRSVRPSGPRKDKKKRGAPELRFFFTEAEAWAGRRRGRMWTPHALWCVRIPGWGLRDLYSSPGRPHGWMEYSAALLLQIRIVSLRFLGLFVSGGGGETVAVFGLRDEIFFTKRRICAWSTKRNLFEKLFHRWV